MENFIYGSVHTDTEGVYVDQARIFGKPSRDVEFVSIPGRNGDLTFSNNRYNNIEIVVNCYIKSQFVDNFASFINKLSAQWNEGYEYLWFSMDPDVYREAQFISATEPVTGAYNEDAKFEIRFNCKPQKFIDANHASWVSLPSATTDITNAYIMKALPIFRTQGNGTLYWKDSINQIISTITVSGLNATDYTYIDSDIQDCYWSSTNRNPNVTMTNGFPVIDGNGNKVSWSGFTKVDYKPRFWRL